MYDVSTTEGCTRAVYTCTLDFPAFHKDTLSTMQDARFCTICTGHTGLTKDVYIQKDFNNVQQK